MILSLLHLSLIVGGWVSKQTWQCLLNLAHSQLHHQALDIYVDDTTDPTELLKSANKSVYISKITKSNKNLIWRDTRVDTVLIFQNSLPFSLIHGPRGRVVLLTNNISTYEHLWGTHKLLDTAIIDANGTEQTEAYTWFPYQKEQCHKRVPSLQLIQRCSPPSYNWTGELYPSKLPRRFNGCRIFYVTVSNPPNIVRSNGSFIGRDMTFMQTVAESFDFHVESFTSTKFFAPGVNGTPDGAMAMIHNGSADFACGSIFLQDNFYFWAEPLPFFRRVNVVWMLPKAGLKPRISGVYSGFSPLIWSLILIAFLAVTLATGITASVEKIPWVWLDLVSCVVASPTTSQHSSRLIRLLLITFQIYGLHVAWFYQSTLLGNLFRQPKEKQLTSLQEAMDAGLTPMIRYWMTEFFNRSDHNLWNKLLADKSNFILTQYDFRAVVLNKTAFMLALQANDRHNLHNEFPRLKHDDMVYVVQPPVDRRPVPPYGRRGSPLTELFHKQSSHLIASGLFAYWTYWTPELTPSRPEAPENKNSPLDLEILQTAFYLLSALLVLCCVVFCIEILITRCKQTFKQKIDKSETNKGISMQAGQYRLRSKQSDTVGHSYGLSDHKPEMRRPWFHITLNE